MSISKLDYSARHQRNAQAKLPSSWFATRELDPSQRFDAWCGTMGVFLDPGLSHHENMESFIGEIEGYLLDDIVFTRAQASRQKFDRRSAKITRDGIDHYMIELFFEGHMEMNMGRRVVRNRPGQIVGFDLGDTMDSFNSGFDLLCIIIPRSRLSPLLARPDSVHGVMPPLDGGPGYFLASYLQTLYRVVPTLTPAEGVIAAQALLGLIAAAFNKASVGWRMDGDVAQESLLLRAQFFIQESLGSTSLSSERIALGVGMSRATLYRLFEPVGGVAGYVRDLRLRKCFTEVISARYATLPVAEIGYRWGFSDPAVFSRAFQRRFGRSPREVRDMAHVYAHGDDVLLGSRAGNRQHEDWIVNLA